MACPEGSGHLMVMVAGYSRVMTARMIPSRQSADLLAGHWALISGLGAVPRALVWKDPSVQMNIHMEVPASPRAHWRLIPMVRLTGPGRVAMQSQYGTEGLAHWGWDGLGPDGSWRNWNPNRPATWRTQDREP